MITYLLKSAACLALLLFFYHLILEKEKMHNFNRFYLLFGIVASFLIPFATITITVEPLLVQASNTTFTPIAESIILPQEIEKPTINYKSILIAFYGVISLIFLIRFSINLFKIIRKTYTNKKVKYKKAVLVLVEDNILPHTFWNYIFINKKDYFNENIEQELFTHELTHATQKHTIDVLLVEFLQIAFWINPLFIFIKKAIQLNHEYLADETVINQHKNTFQYQHLLVNKAAWKNEYYLASNLNYSLTKKRLKMMTTQSSPKKILLKKLAVIPLLTGFFFLFAERVEAQEIIEEKEEPIVEEVSNSKNDLSESELYKIYYYRNTEIIELNKNGKNIVKKYNELTEEEKKKLAPPPPLKLTKKVPTKKQFENLKDKTKYAIWINGKVVKNEVLNNYEASDFARYINSHVYKNARSKRFPQENQVQLETKKYFKFQNQKRVERFLKYLKENHNIEEVEEEIKEQKKKYNSPSSNGSKQSFLEKPVLINSLKTGFKDINGTILYYVITNGKTKFYNKKGFLVNEQGKEISSQKAKASEIIPDNYVKRVFYKNKLFCEFLDDKPKSEKEQFKEIEELEKLVKKENKRYSLKKYLKINELYEFSRQQKPHFVKSDKKRQEKLKEQFSLLGTLYYKLSKKDKKKVKRPIHPHDPYLRLMKNNKVFYKLRSNLTEEDKLLIPPPPPHPNASKEDILKTKKAYKEWEKRTGNKILPPPPPINPLDQIIKMAKKGAIFYFEKEEISSDKAIELLKKNKKLNIHSESTNNSNYKVWISKEQIKKKKQLPDSFIKKANNRNNLVFNSKKEVKRQNESDSKLSNTEKKQLLLRKTIIQATTLNEKKFDLKIEGKKSHINEVYEFIHKNPFCQIKADESKSGNLILDLKKSKQKKMNVNDLQVIYTKVFEKTK